MKKIIALFILAVVVACGDMKIDRTYPDNPENIRKKRAGKFFEGSNFFGSGSKKDDAPKEVVQKDVPLRSSALWAASVEVISGILPLSAADEKTGLIITDWYQDSDRQKKQESKAVNFLVQERIKINLLVKGSEAKRENLILTIFKQTRDKKGEWVDTKSANQDLFVQNLKDKIIQKAKAR